MDHCIRSLCLDHKYCSVTAPLATHACHSVITHPEPLCSCTGHPCVTHRHHGAHGRCSCTGHLPHYTSMMCKKVNVLPTLPCLPTLVRLETVLARRDPDGFYYQGVVRHEEEPGVFLIEFSKPCVQSERYPAMLQKTSVSDIIQYDDAQRHSIVPGDNVLAPWEPELARYGPGTVILGLETRDPLRVMEDEQLTVSFWNGKKANVPLGVALWISPTVYRRIVDMLHHPISGHQHHEDRGGNTTTYVITDRGTTVPVPVCATDHFHRWNHHPAHHPHPTHQHCACCCFPSHQTCTCCYDPKCQSWWPLSPRTTVYVQGKKETGDDKRSYSTITEGEKSRTDNHYFSASSESENEESLEDDTDGETYLSKTTQSTMVDSAVNTDSSLWDKQRTDFSDRPDWKYWKHSQPEPFHRKPGIIKSKSKKSIKDSRAPVPDSFGSTNRSALFETVLDPPARRLTVKDILTHKDLVQTEMNPPPSAAERLGQSEVEKLRRKEAILQKRLQQKLKHREWEEKREEDSSKKYSGSQEAHRKKTQNRLENEELKVREREMKNATNIKAKMAACEERKERNLTEAAEDKKREQRRLDHLRKVREKIDQREFEKCAANEQKDIDHMAAQRRRTEDHYRQIAEKVFQAEQGEKQRVRYAEA
ncbi:uncharacterized protein C11orf16 homolog [Hyperolius riggenbachi]|uniref:uncharacterized protein C11orf16 homolog n=1 Tax=Hyperolius riggenbachi TaxID=752182 RepID=UPI0035A30AC4